MMIGLSDDNDQDHWIHVADLMALLLLFFVFVAAGLIVIMNEEKELATQQACTEQIGLVKPTIDKIEQNSLKQLVRYPTKGAPGPYVDYEFTDSQLGFSLNQDQLKENQKIIIHEICKQLNKDAQGEKTITGVALVGHSSSDWKQDWAVVKERLEEAAIPTATIQQYEKLFPKGTLVSTPSNLNQVKELQETFNWLLSLRRSANALIACSFAARQVNKSLGRTGADKEQQGASFLGGSPSTPFYAIGLGTKKPVKNVNNQLDDDKSRRLSIRVHFDIISECHEPFQNALKPDAQVAGAGVNDPTAQ